MHWAIEFINTMWNLISISQTSMFRRKNMHKVLSAYGGAIRSGGNDGI